MEQREIGGIPITKDNYEDLFDGWFMELDQNDLLDYGEAFGKKVYKQGYNQYVKEEDEGEMLFERDHQNVGTSSDTSPKEQE